MSEEKKTVRRRPYLGESRTTKWRIRKQKCVDEEQCDCIIHNTFNDSDTSCLCEFHKYAKDNVSPSSICSCEYHENANDEYSDTSLSTDEVDISTDKSAQTSLSMKSRAEEHTEDEAGHASTQPELSQLYSSVQEDCHLQAEEHTEDEAGHASTQPELSQMYSPDQEDCHLQNQSLLRESRDADLSGISDWSQCSDLQVRRLDQDEREDGDSSLSGAEDDVHEISIYDASESSGPHGNNHVASTSHPRNLSGLGGWILSTLNPPKSYVDFK